MVAEALIDETDYFAKEAEKAVDLNAFAKDIWPKVKLKDGLKARLVTIFKEQLSSFMPKFVRYYPAQTDKELKFKQVSKNTTAQAENLSEEPAEIMKLNSHFADFLFR